MTNAWEKRDFKLLKNIHATVWNDNGLRCNPLHDQKKDLSDYPAPLSGDKYFTFINAGEIHKNFDPVLQADNYFTFLGRGCIGTCSYCSGRNWSRIYRDEGKKAYKRRNRNLQDVLNEIQALPANVKKVVFADEYWGNSRDLTKEFFTKYKEMGLKPFFAYLDYGQMVNDPDLFNTVLDAGLYGTGIGFQTGSKEFALKYYKRKQNYNLLLEYAHKIYNNFVHLNPQFIGGNCYETWDVFLQTIDIIRKLPFSIESPHSVQLQSTQLKAHPKSPIREIAPKVVTNPMSTREWHYRSVLMDLARILTQDEFEQICKDKHYKDNPAELNKYFHKLLFIKQYGHFKNLVSQQSGQRWVYYGANDAYKRNKSFFSDLKPEIILLDEPYIKDQKSIDGIPVMTPERYFQNQDAVSANFMIFAYSPWMMGKKLLRSYHVPFENIHSCASSWSSPFAADLIDEYVPKENL